MSEDKRLFHITSSEEWAQARAQGSYVPQDYAREGFIHCSFIGQYLKVANIRFVGRGDLVLLEIDRARLGCEVIEENLEGGQELFPHIYGALEIAAVTAVHKFPCNQDGCFSEVPGL